MILEMNTRQVLRRLVIAYSSLRLGDREDLRLLWLVLVVVGGLFEFITVARFLESFRIFSMNAEREDLRSRVGIKIR